MRAVASVSAGLVVVGIALACGGEAGPATTASEVVAEPTPVAAAKPAAQWDAKPYAAALAARDGVWEVELKCNTMTKEPFAALGTVAVLARYPFADGAALVAELNEDRVEGPSGNWEGRSHLEGLAELIAKHGAGELTVTGTAEDGGGELRLSFDVDGAAEAWGVVDCPA